MSINGEVLILEKSLPSTKPKIIGLVFLVPEIISVYLQLFYNLVIVSFIVDTLFKFTRIIEKDLLQELDSKMNIAFSEIFQCSQEYIKNGCGNINLAPALEPICQKWSVCMNHEPKISTSKASVEIFADIINNFFNCLNDRTLICIFSFAICSVLLLNYILGTRHSCAKKISN